MKLAPLTIVPNSFHRSTVSLNVFIVGRSKNEAKNRWRQYNFTDFFFFSLLFWMLCTEFGLGFAHLVSNNRQKKTIEKGHEVRTRNSWKKTEDEIIRMMPKWCNCMGCDSSYTILSSPKRKFDFLLRNDSENRKLHLTFSSGNVEIENVSCQRHCKKRNETEKLTCDHQLVKSDRLNWCDNITLSHRLSAHVTEVSIQISAGIVVSDSRVTTTTYIVCVR